MAIHDPRIDRKEISERRAPTSAERGAFNAFRRGGTLETGGSGAKPTQKEPDGSNLYADVLVEGSQSKSGPTAPTNSGDVSSAGGAGGGRKPDGYGTSIHKSIIDAVKGIQIELEDGREFSAETLRKIETFGDVIEQQRRPHRKKLYGEPGIKNVGQYEAALDLDGLPEGTQIIERFDFGGDNNLKAGPHVQYDLVFHGRKAVKAPRPLGGWKDKVFIGPPQESYGYMIEFKDGKKTIAPLNRK